MKSIKRNQRIQHWIESYHSGHSSEHCNDSFVKNVPTIMKTVECEKGEKRKYQESMFMAINAIKVDDISIRSKCQAFYEYFNY